MEGNKAISDNDTNHEDNKTARERDWMDTLVCMIREDLTEVISSMKTE